MEKSRTASAPPKLTDKPAGWLAEGPRQHPDHKVRHCDGYQRRHANPGPGDRRMAHLRIIMAPLRGVLVRLLKADGLARHGQILQSLVGAKLRKAEKWARRIGALHRHSR